MGFDLEIIRAQTPGLAHVNHLLAAGSALMPQLVIDAVIKHTELEGRIGGYEAVDQCGEQFDGVYKDVASLVGAQSQEIALLQSATAAWGQIFYALPFKLGDRVLTCEAEYASNYVAFLHRAKRDGIVIDIVPSDPSGALDLVAMEAMITDRTRLIAITWVPTNGGLVNPAEGVGEIAKRHNIPYLLDACQAVGQMPVDVGEIGCDFLSATGRKFLRGPRGTGFLFIREPWIDRLHPPMVDLMSAPWTSRDAYSLRIDARRFEEFESSYATRAGLGAAAKYAQDVGLENIQTHSWALAAQLRDGISALKGAEVQDAGTRHCAIVSFTIKGVDPTQAAATLRQQNIIIGTSAASSTRIDAENRKLPTMLRAAPHYYNSDDDIIQLVTALERLID
jgi:cysteine desulfurase/selenocysteine lyase